MSYSSQLSSSTRTHFTPPSRFNSKIEFPRLILSFLLCLLLFTNLLGAWSGLVSIAFAASRPVAHPVHLTYKQYMQQGRNDGVYRGPLIRPQHITSAPGTSYSGSSSQAFQKPDAEPPTMKPISLTLTSSFLTNNPSAQAFDVTGSDKRLEVKIQPGSFNTTHAVLADGSAPKGSLTLKIAENHGHYAQFINLLGEYTITIIDGQGHTVTGIFVRTPITFIYHYQQWEMDALDLDPGKLIMSWPDLLVAARNNHKSIKGLIVTLKNDPSTHTLTGESNDLGRFDMGGGDPQNQSPSIPHLASVGGNSGQLNYSYPLQISPGPAGFAPDLTLSYSSSDPNQRYSRTSPASDMGDGWSLSLGSITKDVYPTGSASSGDWYFINNVDNVSDRLVADENNVDYQTEHISRLHVERQVDCTKINNSLTLPCFKVWDTSGTYYEFGGTIDSTEYWDESTGQNHSYRWNLNKIVAPNEGASGGGYKIIEITYLQDCQPFQNTLPCSKITDPDNPVTVRDSAIQRIIYGTATSINGPLTIDGSVDFSYYAPFNYSTNGITWAQEYPYGTSHYSCTEPNPPSPQLRCDDPVTFSGPNGQIAPPNVMSTLSLESVTSYVGADPVGPGSGNKAYGYTFSYSDSPATSNCYDPETEIQEYCAGEHLLTSITPAVYQSGTAHTLKPVLFGYTDPLHDSYMDSLNKDQKGNQYGGQTFWQYLNSYVDTNTGEGESIIYLTAYSNTHGTPYINNSDGTWDDRHDPLYCTIHANDPNPSNRCQGNYHDPNDHAWSVQVVTQTKTWGKDSGNSQLLPATTTYNYGLAAYGTYNPNDPLPGHCYPGSGSGTPPPGQNDCVYDTWTPASDSDWTDYYHGEFHGFNIVYITSPSNNLTMDYYYSTEGSTPNTNSGNYNSGNLFREDVYNGNAANSANLLRETYDTYPVNPGSCASDTNITYDPCEPMVLTSTTAYCEGAVGCTATTTANATWPWVETNYTYDDFGSSGLEMGNGHYHNLLEADITSSNAPKYSQKWTYNTTDTTVNNWRYYTVDKVKHSEIDDASGTVWQCVDTFYDEGAPGSPPTPAAGWPTTIKNHSNCANPTGSLITSYIGYDVYGNPITTVDGVATSNTNLYSGGANGCLPSTTPAVVSPTWNTGSSTTYTTCTNYDSYNAQPASATNALGLSSTMAYDYERGALPVQVTDVKNNVTTNTAYSYDPNSQTNGKSIISVTLPDPSGNYTSQSSTYSGCVNGFPSSVTYPCYEADSVSQQYNQVTSHTFYDSMGRAVETRAPGPVSGQDTVGYTVYNEATNSVFQSLPFVVPTTLNNGEWIDPNSTQGSSAGGTAIYYDALGRPIAYDDAIFEANQVPGIACPPLKGNATACAIYGVGTAQNDTNLYETTRIIDPNNHVTDGFTDALGRNMYIQYYSGTAAGTLTINEQKAIQYNVLGEPTSVTDTDMAPLTSEGQKVTSSTTTATYDSMGRLKQLVDPDRGTHTYKYDDDGRLTEDDATQGSATQTIGYNYDLLGRLGCVQDAAPTINATGACSAGRPFVENTYDTSKLTLSGTQDYPWGQLTQSTAFTYYPDGSSVSTTDQFEHDARERLIGEQMTLNSQGGSWSLPTLPTYQMVSSYNDANQVTAETTSSILSGTSTPGESIIPQYDSTVGTLTGVNDGTHNLASMDYNAQAQVQDINFLNSSGATLATESFTYDGDLRPATATTCWQSVGCGGTNGTIYSESIGYDPAGNVISKATTQSAVNGQNGTGGSETENFCYDEQNRLVWAGNTGTQPSAGNGTCGNSTLNSGIAGASYNKTYTYTHLGQLLQVTDSVNQTQSQYLYCDAGHPHQLTGIYSQGSTCPSKGTASYTSSYTDSNGNDWGNMVQRTVGGVSATLSYDNLDQLTEWNTGSTVKGQEWYAYDASGNRTMMRSTSNNSTTITVYPFGVEEHNYNTSGNNLGNKYYYSLGGRLIAELKGTTPTLNFLVTDMLGTVTSAFSRDTATVQGNQGFDPFGNARYASGTMGTFRGFTGQLSDSLSGLDYYGARYYDPVAGIFLSTDPTVGNFQGANPYAYVGNNPETYSDPTGLHRYGLGVRHKGMADHSWQHASDGEKWLMLGEAAMGAAYTLPDMLFGLSSMKHEMLTLIGWRRHTSLEDRVRAGVGLAINVGLALLTLNDVVGAAEHLGEEIALHGGEDLALHEGEDAAIHEGEGLAREGLAREGEAAAREGEGLAKTLYHYTTEDGYKGILESGSLNPSLNPRFAHYGSGQYLTDIAPEAIRNGGMSLGDLSQSLFNKSSVQFKLSHFIEININGLEVIEGRPHVFLIPGESPLNLTGRIVRFGLTLP